MTFIAQSYFNTLLRILTYFDPFADLASCNEDNRIVGVPVLKDQLALNMDVHGSKRILILGKRGNTLPCSSFLGFCLKKGYRLQGGQSLIRVFFFCYYGQLIACLKAHALNRYKESKLVVSLLTQQLIVTPGQAYPHRFH